MKVAVVGAVVDAADDAFEVFGDAVFGLWLPLTTFSLYDLGSVGAALLAEVVLVSLDDLVAVPAVLASSGDLVSVLASFDDFESLLGSLDGLTSFSTLDSLLWSRGCFSASTGGQPVSVPPTAEIGSFKSGLSVRFSMS